MSEKIEELETSNELIDLDKVEEEISINEPTLPSEIHKALITNNSKDVFDIYNDTSAVFLAEILSTLSHDEIVIFYSIINRNYDKLGEIFSYLNVEEKMNLVNTLEKRKISLILANVSNDDLIDFLMDIPVKHQSKVLTNIPSKRQKILKHLATYSTDTVGSIMTTEYLSVLTGSKISEIFNQIKEVGSKLETVQTIFIVDKNNKLLGVERLENMMFENEDEVIDKVMKKDYAYISPIADKESAIPICQEYDIPVLPVVSKKGEMLGILTFDDVMDVLEQESTEDTLKQGAVSPTEKPYMENKAYKIALSYVLWLVILLIINTFTSMIISRFENALLTLPVLISFIPALNDSVGNSSSQTTSMVIRALTTGELEKKDYFKVILREFLVGLITGLIVAVFDLAWVMMELNTPILSTDSLLENTELLKSFNNNIQLVYLSIAAITAFSLLIGIAFSKLFAAILPLIAKALKIDPAIMSGPLMTCLMDIITLILYFSIATVLLDSLAPGTIEIALSFIG